MTGIVNSVLEARFIHALLECMWATWAELAALRQIDQRQRRARDRMQAFRLRTDEARDRPEQAPCVGMLRVVEQLPFRATLHDAARIRDDDLVRDVRDDAEV